MRYKCVAFKVVPHCGDNEMYNINGAKQGEYNVRDVWARFAIGINGFERSCRQQKRVQGRLGRQPC